MAGAVGRGAAMVAGGHLPEAPPEETDDDADAAAPRELLAPLLEEWREVLVTHVLSQLDPTDCAMLARVAKPWLAVVLASNLPRAGKQGSPPLKLVDFVGSAERLAWAKANGCPWQEITCQYAAVGRCRFNRRLSPRSTALGFHLECKM